MVGVPGRSKACHNCRKRRIKCGEERPGCHNCAKSNRLCSGYQRNHAFILSKDMVTGTQQDGTAATSGDSELVVFSPADVTSNNVHISRWRAADRRKGSPDSLESPSSSSSLSSSSSQKKKSRSSPLPHHHISPSLFITELSQRNVFRDLFFSLFVTDSIPTNGKPNPVPSNYMLDILQLPTLSPALENATLALCAAKLGKRDKSPELLHQSLGLYTQGLRDFAREVGSHVSRDVGRTTTEQTLAACMVMMLYEVSECPAGSVDAYQAHYNGTVKLLELRGPEAHRSGLSHSIFQAFRVHNMYLSFVNDTRSLLSEPEWCSIPFGDGPKEHFDQILDILLEVSNLCAARSQIRDMRDPKLIFRHSLATIRTGLQLERQLAAWLGEFQSTIGGPLYHPELSQRHSSSSSSSSPLDEDGQGELFPVAFHFPAFSVAQNMLFYWTALLSVHAHLGWMYGTMKHLNETTLDLIRPSLSCTCSSANDDCIRHFTMDDSSSSSSLPPLGARIDWPRTTAYSICQSVEYCMQERGRSFGPVSILPVLSVVKGHWVHWPGDWSREIAWVDEIFSALGQEKSMIARYLVEEELYA